MADLDPTVDAPAVRKGAAVWAMVGLIGGTWLLGAYTSWQVTTGVLLIGGGCYFAAINAIYHKIEHFQEAVRLWNTVKDAAPDLSKRQMAYNAIGDQRPEWLAQKQTFCLCRHPETTHNLIGDQSCSVTGCECKIFVESD